MKNKSVPTPINGNKVSETKSPKISKKSSNKIVKKMEKAVAHKPQETKLKIRSIEHVDFGRNLQSLKTIKSESTNVGQTIQKIKKEKSEKTEIEALAKKPEIPALEKAKKKTKVHAVEPSASTVQPKKFTSSKIKVEKENKLQKPQVTSGETVGKKAKVKKELHSEVNVKTEKKSSDAKRKVKKEIENAMPKVLAPALQTGKKRLKSEIEKKQKAKKPKIHVSDTDITSKIDEKVKFEKKSPAKSKKRKLSKKSTATSEVNLRDEGDLKLSDQHILKCIRSIVELTEKKKALKKSLLPTENLPVLLQVECVKIAATPRRQIRPILPHQLAGPLDDVAIFVPDVEIGRSKDYEKTVDHWEAIFQENGIDSIKEIIPINRIKTEYSQFEMRRKLAMSFDYFLADGRICGHLTHLLGKDFFKRRSAPTPVRLEKKNIKERINVALHKTCLEIHSYGNTHSVQVGSLSMEAKKILENIWATCETLAKEYPGGWANIRAIRIKTEAGCAVPIYMTLKSKNTITAPRVTPKRPRAYETVEGELTTVNGDCTVTVTPEGKVKVLSKKSIKKEDEEHTNGVKMEIKEETDDDDE